jgi:hypothetical protein
MSIAVIMVQTVNVVEVYSENLRENETGCR